MPLNNSKILFKQVKAIYFQNFKHKKVNRSNSAFKIKMSLRKFHLGIKNNITVFHNELLHNFMCNFMYQ